MKKTQIALVTLGVLALAGGGTALANKGKGVTHARLTASDPRGGHSDELDVAASYLGTTVDKLITQLQAGKTLADLAGSKTSGLIDALVAAEKTELADAVKAGKLTQSQADTISGTLTQRFTDLVNGTRSGWPGRGWGHGPADHDLDAAASYLGTTASALITQLRAGKTLADIAGSKTSGLIAALVADKKQELAAAVTSGKLTQSQADTISGTLTQRVTDFVNGVRPVGPPHGGPFGGGGPGPFDGFRSHGSRA